MTEESGQAAVAARRGLVLLDLEKDHLFGNNYNMDDPILDCLMTYGLEPTDKVAKKSGYKRVEIFLRQIDEVRRISSWKPSMPIIILLDYQTTLY